MKRLLCFKITAKLGNPKRQQYSRQEYICVCVCVCVCVCKVGTTVQKAHKRKEDGKTGKADEFLFTYEP